MVSVEKWAMWDSAVEVDVTEGAALPTAHALIAAAIDETEAVCDFAGVTPRFTPSTSLRELRSK